MEEPIDWCKFFADIEKDPKAIVPRITVRQMIQAREHLANCDNCDLRMQRVEANAPKPKFPERGTN